MKDYYDITGFFDALSDVDYTILRNHEVFEYGMISLDEHPDLDILCSDPDFLFAKLKLTCQYHKDGRPFAYVNISEKKVLLDLRIVGDGYYDKNWQIDMLKSKVVHKNYNVLDDENYFYSLLYHAFIHKKAMPQDYLPRLNLLAESIGIKADFTKRKDSLLLLELFMTDKNYKYTTNKTFQQSLKLSNFSDVNSGMIKFDHRRLRTKLLLGPWKLIYFLKGHLK